MVNKINISQGIRASGGNLSLIPGFLHPLLGRTVGFSAHGIGLIFRSKLFLVSIVLTAILLGGLAYIVTHKALVAQQSGIQSGSTTGESSGTSAQDQTTDTQSTTGSSAPATTTKPPAASPTTSAPGTATAPSTPSAPAAPTTPTPPSGGGSLSNGSCFASPSSCGYPDATNTGVPSGTTLLRVPEDVTSGTGWTWDSRGWLSASDGAIVENLIINGSVEVTGNNVIVRNNRILETGESWAVALRTTVNTTVSRNTIGVTGAPRLMVGIKDIYGDSTGSIITGNNISNASTGIQTAQGTIADNYIHDLGMISGDHVNGTTANGGTDPMTIRHNTIFNSFDQTDAISIFQDFGIAANVLITNNYLAGGGYTIYGGGGSYGTATNIRITDNRISDRYYANGGYWGWMAYYDAAGSGNVCSGNIMERTATGATEALGC